MSTNRDLVQQLKEEASLERVPVERNRSCSNLSSERNAQEGAEDYVSPEKRLRDLVYSRERLGASSSGAVFSPNVLAKRCESASLQRRPSQPRAATASTYHCRTGLRTREGAVRSSMLKPQPACEEAPVRKKDFPNCEKDVLDFYWNINTRRHS